MAYAPFDSVLKSASITLSGSNKTATRDAGSGYAGAALKASGQGAGKWYCEFLVNTDLGNSNIGIALRASFPTGNYFGSGADYGIHAFGSFYGPSAANPWDFAGYTSGDVISVLYDGDANTVEFWKNGVSIHAPTSVVEGAYVPGYVAYSATEGATVRTDPAEWTYTPPAGYSAWESYDVTSTVAETLPMYTVTNGWTMVETLAMYSVDTGFTVVETLPMYSLDTGAWALNELPRYFLDTGILADVGPNVPTMSASVINDPPWTRVLPMYILYTGMAVAQMLPAPTLDATSSLELTESAVISPAPTLGCSGFIGKVGNLAGTLPQYELEVYDTGAANDLPRYTLAATSLVGRVASLSQVFPAFTSDAEATLAAAGYADAQIPSLRLSSIAYHNATAELAHDAPAPHLVATGTTGAVFSLAATTPMFALVAVAYGEYVLTVDETLPARSLQADASEVVISAFRTWTMTLNGRGVTEYDNFAFNSYAVFRGKVLAASAAGVHELAAQTTDESASAVFDKISATVRTGKENFGTGYNKRVPRIYAAYAASEALEFSTIISHDGKRTYLLPGNHLAGIQQRRVPVGRGPKAPYWQFELQNVEGADFVLDHLTIYPEQSYRRVL